MATFVSLISFTDQGVRNIKDSPDRFEAFRAMAEASGVTVRSVYWTMGSRDMVVTVDGPEETAAAVMMKVSSLGNVRSETLRGYGPEEMRRILGRMP